jgi:lysophospholipase L1-like esterase
MRSRSCFVVLFVILAATVVSVSALLVRRTSDRVRILPVGDSITAGYTDRDWRVPFSFGYRSHLFELLTANGCKVQFVGGSPEPWRSEFSTPDHVAGIDLRPIDQDHHRGYGGWRIADLTRSLPAWLESDRPDIILFMAGVNDVGDATPDATLRSDMTNAIETIQRSRPSAKLFVGTITPAVHSNNPASARFNKFISGDLAKAAGFSVVDQFSAFADSDGKARPELFANGINHPTPASYDRMADTWFAAIKDVACDPHWRSHP